jgi:hypothetical protein
MVLPHVKHSFYRDMLSLKNEHLLFFPLRIFAFEMKSSNFAAPKEYFLPHLRLMQ